MRHIELVRQSTRYFVYIPEDFETIVKSCAKKLEKEKYRTLRIYRKFNLYEIHDDLVYRMTSEIISWYKQNVSIPRGSTHIMFNFHRTMINQTLKSIEISINLWMMYAIMSITVPSTNILQYTYYKKHMYLDLKGLPAVVKPMEPKFTYRIPDDSSKYILFSTTE